MISKKIQKGPVGEIYNLSGFRDDLDAKKFIIQGYGEMRN